MHPLAEADINSSGITPSDLEARMAEGPELAATGVVGSSVLGYVIPYWDIEGNPLPHYRVKFLNLNPKYKQPRGSSNHLYFPLQFQKVLKQSGLNLVILTEGEKKAVAGCKAGFPTVALGGIYNWKNRTLILPGDSILKQAYSGKKVLQVKLPSTQVEPYETTVLAVGMFDLTTLVTARGLQLIIIFDSDLPDGGVKPLVQVAAATLGYELHFLGLPTNRIRQLILPTENENKIGLDDFLVKHKSKGLLTLVREVLNRRNAFPRHPNPKEFIGHELQKGKLSRKETQRISLAVLAELDARGRRLRSKATSQPYYFDEVSRKLVKAALLQKHGEPLHESPFGTLLYREFGLSAADNRVIVWLASQFTGEPPTEEVTPQKVLTLAGDDIALQISDSQFVIITSNPKKSIEVLSNGSRGILFEQDQVESINAQELQDEFDKLQGQPLTPWWSEVLNTLSFDESSKQFCGYDNDMATLLFYISPWLNRWRGVQLPVEIVTGEADSGKSSLYCLRLSIITGKPLLRNVPFDLRDWHSSITSVGGLHVTDNVQFTNKDLRQRISDEICRITTEPQPHIEMRKLYTTATQVQVPVSVVFAMTAIQQPFFNADLVQRSVIFSLQAIRGTHDSSWVEHQLSKFGGRVSWLAHHLLVLHRFLELTVKQKMWNSEFSTTHRLAHYEQSLSIMAKVLGIDNKWIPKVLSQSTHTMLSEADWALDGLKEFAKITPKNEPFTSSDIASWAQTLEDYADNIQLTNARRLGRYIQAHKYMIENSTGIKEIGTQANRKTYIIRR